MTSGRRLLTSIERALAESRTEFRLLDLEMQANSAALGRVRAREATLYRRLASARLADIAEGDFGAEISRVEQRVAELLDERDRDAQGLNERIESAEQSLQAQEDERAHAAQARDEAAVALSDLLDQVDERLAADDDYQARVEAVERKLDTAANAERKTTEAEVRRDEKRVPFDEDPLFSYLWSRGYGTADYRAGLFARFGDGRVARHIRYEDARRKYHALTEIPRRLRAHTERMEAEAATAAEALAEFERAADVEAGAEALETTLAAAERRCDAIDRDIEAAEQALQALYAERDAFAEARDPLWQKAMQLLDEGLRQTPIPELRREASLTPTRADDEIVDELDDMFAERDRLSAYIDDHREAHARRARRVEELSSIRRRYKQKQFDAPHSRIDDRADLERQLASFLQGLMTGDGLWRAIRHAQRFRRQHHHGKFGRPGGGIRMPRGVRVRFPRSSGGSFGGGFGSRGGFGGGGGFRNKGGF